MFLPTPDRDISFYTLLLPRQKIRVCKIDAAEAGFENTIQKLEQHLDCTREALNLEDLWAKTNPMGQSESLCKATGKIYQILTYRQYLEQVIDPFVADYEAAHQGRKPFIKPVLRARHEHAQQITPSEYEEAVKAREKFSEWVTEILFATLLANETPLLIFLQS